MAQGERGPDVVDAGSALHRVHPARVEIELDPEHSVPAQGLLRANLRDPVALVFLAAALLAQLADAVTTTIALRSASFYEENSLMRQAVTHPVVTGTFKVTLVGLMGVLILLRVPTRAARLGLYFLFGISAFAPIQNLVQLLVR